ncbi:MAG TPA: hypothetical protein VGN32_08740 [Ktedonobacterales bacterium]|nr:hypothetical protein [Ktedonobacterales bacterium]
MPLWGWGLGAGALVQAHSSSIAPAHSAADWSEPIGHRDIARFAAGEIDTALFDELCQHLKGTATPPADAERVPTQA